MIFLRNGHLVVSPTKLYEVILLNLSLLLFWQFQVTISQVTFLFSHEHKLNLQAAQADIYGVALSEIMTQAIPVSGGTQFKYLTVDQYRQISLQSTIKLGSSWSMSQLAVFPGQCDQNSKIGKIISIPNTGYFYGTSVQTGATTSNCSTGLFNWDVTAVSNGVPQYQRSFLAAGPLPLRGLDLVAIGSDYLVLSNQSYIRVSDNQVFNLGTVQASLSLGFMACTVLQNFPVWAVEQSTALVRIYSLSSISGFFTQLSVNGLPPVTALVIGAKQLGATAGTFLLATRSSLFAVNSIQATQLNVPGSPGDINALIVQSDTVDYSFTLLRAGALEAFTLTNPGYLLGMVTRVDLSSHEISPGNIHLADPSTLVAISANKNQILFFDAKQPCDAACKKCSGPTFKECITCATNARKDLTSSSTCYICGEGFQVKADQTACIACAPGCANCPSREVSPEAACQTCFSGLFKDQTDPKMCRNCPSAGSYLTSGNLCALCSSNCNTCTSSSTCTLCNSGFYLSNSVCSSCDTTNCDQCSNNGQICVKCKSGYYFSGLNTCSKCDDSDCEECYGSGLFKCTNCREGFYLELFNNTCQPCMQNCKSCVNNRECTSCKTGFTIVKSQSVALPSTCQNCSEYSGYYLYEKSGIQLCDKCSSNCTSCSGLATNCSSCAAHFYLMNTVCYNCRQNCTHCVSPWDCTDCIPDTFLSSTNRSCTLCGHGYFVDADALTCRPYSDNCLKCSGIAACQLCDSLREFYVGPTGYCMHLSSFSSMQGIDVSDKSVKSCIDPNCVNCLRDHTNCIACDVSSGWYRNDKICKLKSTFLVNQGVDLVNLTVQLCIESHCTNCTDNYQICRRCDFENNWYLNSTGACVTGQLIPPGQGINRQNSTVQSCKLSECLGCRDDYSVCYLCNEGKGFSLVNQTCRPSLLIASLQPAINTASDQDLSFQLTLASSFSQDVVKKALIFLQQNSTITFKFNSIKSGDEHPSNMVITKIAGLNSLSITAKFSGYLPESQYQVSVSVMNLSFVHSDNTTYFISAAAATATYDNPVDLAQAKVLKQQQAAGELLSSVAPGSSPAAGSVTLAVIAMDPTGTFFRFTKMLQILGRIYHLNINFGKRLDAFLLKTTSGEKVHPDYLVRHSRYTRGKLSTHLVPLDSVQGQLFWKICLYWCCWFLWPVTLLMQKNSKLYKAKTTIYFTFFLNRAHWAVFNLTFGELLWLLPRTVLHSRGLALEIYFATAVTSLLVFCDFVCLLRLISNNNRWRRFAIWASPNFTEKKSPVKSQAKSDVNPDASNPENQPQTKQINYKKTYFEIGCNFPLMEMVSGSFIPREIIGDSLACRYLCLSPWFRLVFIQVLISSCQYANQLAITLMLINELCRGFLSVYVHLEHKLFASVPTLSSEILQSVFLSSIWCLLLFQASIRFDEAASDSSQDLTVWLILISCLIEYFMLLVFLCKAIWSFWRARHLMFRLGVQKATQNFIHYSKQDEKDKGSSKNMSMPEIKNVEMEESTSKLFASMNPRKRLLLTSRKLNRSISSLNSMDQMQSEGSNSPNSPTKHRKVHAIFQKK